MEHEPAPVPAAAEDESQAASASAAPSPPAVDKVEMEDPAEPSAEPAADPAEAEKTLESKPHWTQRGGKWQTRGSRLSSDEECELEEDEEQIQRRLERAQRAADKRAKSGKLKEVVKQFDKDQDFLYGVQPSILFAVLFVSRQLSRSFYFYIPVSFLPLFSSDALRGLRLSKQCTNWSTGNTSTL